MKTLQKIVSVVCTLAVTVTITSSFPIGETFVRAEEIRQTDEKTFVYEDLFYEVLDDGNLMLRGPSDLVYNAKELVIPAEVNGKKVTRIREFAFHGRELETVEIPDTITHIGSSAFELCSKLKSVKLGNSVKTIGSCAFAVTSIETLTLPDSVINIDWGAFANCASLKSVTIPSGVKIISNRLFMGCTGLEKVTIPDSVTQIGKYAFSGCTSLVNISLSHNIKTICESAFYNCSNLNSIFIPNSTKKIENNAFSNCYKLNDVYYSGTIEQWDEISISFCNEELKNATIHYNSTEPGTLDNETKPMSGKCGDNLTCTLDENGLLTISGTGEMYDFGIYEGPAPWWQSNLDSVFDKSLSIKAVTIENGVSSIGGNAFWNCDDIKSISLPESVVTIGGGAFLGCTGLTSISIPKGTAVIEADAGVSGYEWGTFAACNSLTEIKVDADNPCYKSVDGVLFTKDDTELVAYPGGKQDKKYIIPDGTEKIACCAFDDNDVLTNVIIPNTITEIGGYAFSGCENLTNITIPGSVAELSWCQFEGCTSLNSVVMQEGITKIDYYAFGDCKNLTQVDIPKSMVSIGSGGKVVGGVVTSEIPCFQNCEKLKDVYYGGVKEDWLKIKIVDDVIKNATIHYNSTGSEETNETYEIVYFLNGYDPETDKIIFADDGNRNYTISNKADKSVISSMLNKYVLAEWDKDTNTIMSLKSVESKIGTISAFDQNAYTITIGGEVYPFSKDNFVLTLLEDQQIGKDVLFHTYEGTVVALNFVEKKIGKLESWDNTAKELTIDGKVYPTNYMSNLSGVEKLVGKEIVFLTTLDAYSPVFKAELYNQPVVDSFNADIYHANKLVENPKTLKPLDEQTPSYEMQNSLTENVNKFWLSFSKLMDIGSSPSSVYNYASGIDQKDMYEALILDSLKATVSYNIIPSELEESVKISKELVSDIGDYLKSKYLIDLNNKEDYSKIADFAIARDIEDYADTWFKENQPKYGWLDYDSLSTSLKWVSNGFKITGCIYDVGDYFLSCITLAQIDSNIIKILEQSYQYCLNNSNYGANDPLTQAFLEVREMYETGTSGVWSSLLEGSVKIVGVGAVEYLCDELWDEVLKGTVLKNPNAAIILAGISAGKTVTKLLFNSDDVAEQYIKMKSITDIEAVVDEIFGKNQSAFKIQSNEQNAKLFLASIRLSFQMRDVDCDQAIKYLDELDKGLLNRLPPNWGNTREKQKQVLQNKKSAYQNQYWNAERFWVEFLKDDYPNSGLFEKYSPLLSDEAMKVFFDIKKESMAWCPINIYVYDDQDNLVAYIENSRVSCSADDLTIAQNGDEKIIRFHSNANYRVEYVGYDTGDMDVTINEFGADSKIERTVNYNNVLLNNGKAYYLNFASENMKPYNLVDKDNGSDRSFDYDSMSAIGKHNVKIISGTMRQNDVTCIETAASNGEVLYLDAFVPEGYTLVNWECSSNNAIIDDITAANTKMIMPDEDVIVTAVLNVPNSVYKVSFNTNGGEVSPLHKMTGINSRLEALPTPVYENHTFDGWFTADEGGEQITADTTFTENTTVYAHWTKNNGDSNNSNRGSSLLTGVTIAIISILLAGGALVVIFRKKNKKH